MPVLLVAAAVVLGFFATLAIFTAAYAAATPCGASCGMKYSGQTTAVSGGGFSGIHGYIGFPSTTLTAPFSDALLHWMGLTLTSLPAGYTDAAGQEWLQFGAWNGDGNGGSSSSSYDWYGEMESWCSGYSATTYGTAASSAAQYFEAYYTGNSYNCGQVGTTVYEIKGRVGSAGTFKSVWVLGSSARADANSEIHAYSYFEPLGGTICYGGVLSGRSCTASTADRLQLHVVSWSDWVASTNSFDTWSGYWHTVLDSNYRFSVSGSY